MYEGRGQWIEVGPTLRKHIEVHLTIPEIKTILSWDHMGITRLDSALENKVFNMFSRNMEMDEKSDRASSNEDDFSVKHSPSIGNL